MNTYLAAAGDIALRGSGHGASLQGVRLLEAVVGAGPSTYLLLRRLGGRSAATIH